ncbi:hypothetical protein P261_01515 [Lachnospiraceae bacterium TWA4]|nr:hypothetical protein P261_01515 [Lachnospiraceae bacterium TWA4]
MMNQYYLVSQLPGLDGLDERASLPINTEEFKEVCSRFLSPTGMKTLDSLSIVPNREGVSTGSALVDEWNRGERLLRLALGSVRASNMKKQFDVGDVVLPSDMIQAARTAVGMGDPLAAEQYLNHYRVDSLDRLRPLDSFCEDAVFYYGLKLMLLERMQKFDEKKGIESYQKIYDSILNGDNQEK